MDEDDLEILFFVVTGVGPLIVSSLIARIAANPIIGVLLGVFSGLAFVGASVAFFSAIS